MKKRLLNFMALVLSVLIICGCAVGYIELQSIRVRELENKAIIAQVQASIIQAQGQMKIDRAVAFQLYVNSFLLIGLTVAPYLMLFFLIGVFVYERLQKHISTDKHSDV